MTVLVVVAHPDDETLGCGATIARLVDEGETVHVTCLGKTRVPRSDLERAVNTLGATLESTMALPDQRFDTIPLHDITEWVENHIRLLQPETVFTHAYEDINEDHRIIHRAVLPAIRPVNECSVRNVYTIEIPGSTSFLPNVYIDIAKTLDRKLLAMDMYGTETRQPPHPRSGKMLTALALMRGSQAGVEAAEAFQLIRQIDAV